jgi:hypothetical protein
VNGMSIPEENFARKVQFCTSLKTADTAPVRTNTDCLFSKEERKIQFLISLKIKEKSPLGLIKHHAMKSLWSAFLTLVLNGSEN